MAGPFYFAWVDDADVVFSPSDHVVMDEDIAGFTIEHQEGQIPTLNLTIRNPRVGLLSVTRKQWAWLSYDTGSEIKPIYFGRLVGIPSDFLGNVIELQFVSKHSDYAKLKQLFAETLKVAPYYDPVFLDVARRDDPDAILEGYSALYHVDRTDIGAVTSSDILDGEDGLEEFNENEVPYDSVKVSISQPPLRAVQVRGKVTWTQRTPILPINFGRYSKWTLTGTSLVGDWPKPGSGLNGGWSVGASTAIDVYNTAHGVFGISLSGSINDISAEHENCDITQVQWQQSFPMGGAGFISAIIFELQTIGICDPFSDPPNNIPGRTNTKTAYISEWLIATNLVLNYQANRPRSEDINFFVAADTQAVLTDPDVPKVTDAELIEVNGADVGLPLIDVKSWLSVSGHHVSIGTVILIKEVGSPLILTPTYQICIAAGTAGAVEPSFAFVAGQITIDGTVTWACMGTSLPTSPPDWGRRTTYTPGDIILPLLKYGELRWEDMVPPDSDFSGQGGDISYGQIINTGTSQRTTVTDHEIMVISGQPIYQVCTQPGTTEILSAKPTFHDQRYQETVDGGVVWTCLGNHLPDGKNYALCIQGGTSGEIEPGFASEPGVSETDTIFTWATVGNSPVDSPLPVESDGGVIWIMLGPTEGALEIPIGDVMRRSYFPIERGQRSIEYLLSVARAHLRLRARAVKIEFDCRFIRALDLSCRKNVLLHDPRLPGGQAIGKIVAYKIINDPDKGHLIGQVTLECAVGGGTSSTAIDGTPSYVAEGYVELGYQFYEGQIILHDSGEIGYSVPEDKVNDDGLVFPLTKDQAIVREMWHGDYDRQIELAQQGLANLAKASQPVYGSAQEQYDKQLLIQKLMNRDANHLLAHYGIWYELELKPVTGISFGVEYTLQTTELSIPKMVDLSADS